MDVQRLVNMATTANVTLNPEEKVAIITKNLKVSLYVSKVKIRRSSFHGVIQEGFRSLTVLVLETCK